MKVQEDIKLADLGSFQGGHGAEDATRKSRRCARHGFGTANTITYAAMWLSSVLDCCLIPIERPVSRQVFPDHTREMNL
jgi:hypothetical protein